MKEQKNLIKLIAALTVFAIASFVYSINRLEASQNEYKKFIGTKYKLGNDSLMVVDCNLLLGTFTLSNGMTVDESLITKSKK